MKPASVASRAKLVAQVEDVEVAMAVDEELRAQVRVHLSTMGSIEEEPMVGGIGFMWRGHLLCSVRAEDLLVRIATEDYDRFIGDEGAKPMVMAGRTGKSWILVHKSIVSRRPVLTKWLDGALEFVGSLPTK